MYLSDLITYIPFAYLAYYANVQSGLTSTDWEGFAGTSIFMWIIQAFTTFVAAAIYILFLYSWKKSRSTLHN